MSSIPENDGNVTTVRIRMMMSTVFNLNCAVFQCQRCHPYSPPHTAVSIQSSPPLQTTTTAY
ncbi:hypothetical protein TYRP_010029 [Tyrophagus putrescentiae]|nr:hypothetical protein TYRP_010029 [Tyrophagus putrescentiae]